MAKAEAAELLWRIGDTAMAWRGARDAAEADTLVAAYHSLLRELGTHGRDADAIDLMDTLPDVLMPPGWRTEEPSAPPPMPRDDDWRSAQLWDAYAEAMRQHGVAAHASTHP
jgi:hypothetical protein